MCFIFIKLLRFGLNVPCRHSLWFWPMFQHRAHPMTELDSGIRLMELFVYHLDHIYCRLTETVYSHRSLHAEFVLCCRKIAISYKYRLMKNNNR